MSDTGWTDEEQEDLLRRKRERIGDEAHFGDSGYSKENPGPCEQTCQDTCQSACQDVCQNSCQSACQFSCQTVHEMPTEEDREALLDEIKSIQDQELLDGVKDIQARAKELLQWADDTLDANVMSTQHTSTESFSTQPTKEQRERWEASQEALKKGNEEGNAAREASQRKADYEARAAVGATRLSRHPKPSPWSENTKNLIRWGLMFTVLYILGRIFL